MPGFLGRSKKTAPRDVAALERLHDQLVANRERMRYLDDETSDPLAEPEEEGDGRPRSRLYDIWQRMSGEQD